LLHWPLHCHVDVRPTPRTAAHRAHVACGVHFFVTRLSQPRPLPSVGEGGGVTHDPPACAGVCWCASTLIVTPRPSPASVPMDAVLEEPLSANVHNRALNSPVANTSKTIDRKAR
jgi:hypothetical protein